MLLVTLTTLVEFPTSKVSVCCAKFVVPHSNQPMDGVPFGVAIPFRVALVEVIGAGR
jgi:hypothetical protein